MQDSFKKPTWIVVEGQTIKFKSNGETGRYFKVSDSVISQHRQKCLERGETKFIFRGTTFYTYDPADEFIPKRPKFIGIVTETIKKEESRIKPKSLLPGLDCYMSGRRAM